ncbi:MAG: hypothetical protein M0Z55_03525 [Peptococcaceae bacterium]|nr:hypothetical protein [Peptococcaceae bacterium]
MHFNMGAFLLDKFTLLFAAACIGLAFGKIKFGKFSFGFSGTLFSGLILGWGAVSYAKSIPKGDALFATAQKAIAGGAAYNDFFNLFLIIFIAAVGLLTGKDIGKALKKYGIKFLVIGFVITFTGIAATYGYIAVNKNYNAYEISGIYSGALTSSPGLAASLETVKDQASTLAHRYSNLPEADKSKVLKMVDTTGNLTPENTPTLNKDQIQKFIKTAQSDVSLGHVLAFPFGLLTIILSMVFIPKIFRIDVEKEKQIYELSYSEVAATGEQGPIIKENDFNLLAFTFVCIIGYFLGSLVFSLGVGKLSLGSTGGVLIAALVFSYIGKIGSLNFRMSSKILGIIRQLGLGLFLATVGLMYGYDVISVFAGSGLAIAMMGLSVVVAAILIGFLVGRYIFKLNWTILSGAICGGMTSTPGLGVAVDIVGSNDPAIGYGAVYPIALIYKVLLIMILHRLFVI